VPFSDINQNFMKKRYIVTQQDYGGAVACRLLLFFTKAAYYVKI